jgi:hypothetical protein
MDRGSSSSRGRGWQGRGHHGGGRGGGGWQGCGRGRHGGGGGGRGRPSPPTPSSTAYRATVNPTPTPASTVDDAAPIVGTCPDMCPGNPLLAHISATCLFGEGTTCRVDVPMAPMHLLDEIMREVRSSLIDCVVIYLMDSVVSVAARERAQRERLRDLAVLERVGGDPAQTSPSLAVKKVSCPFCDWPCVCSC